VQYLHITALATNDEKLINNAAPGTTACITYGLLTPGVQPLLAGLARFIFHVIGVDLTTSNNCTSNYRGEGKLLKNRVIKAV
jgi:hypothetical protein